MVFWLWWAYGVIGFVFMAACAKGVNDPKSQTHMKSYPGATRGLLAIVNGVFWPLVIVSVIVDAFGRWLVEISEE